MRSSEGLFGPPVDVVAEQLGHGDEVAGRDASSSPSSIRKPSSRRSRIASWSCSGMPSSMPIVRMGICAPRSAMKSNRPAPTSGSRLRAQNSRTFGSRAFIFFGVNTRESSPR